MSENPADKLEQILAEKYGAENIDREELEKLHQIHLNQWRSGVPVKIDCNFLKREPIEQPVPEPREFQLNTRTILILRGKLDREIGDALGIMIAYTNDVPFCDCGNPWGLFDPDNQVLRCACGKEFQTRVASMKIDAHGSQRVTGFTVTATGKAEMV
jgi:hypothetical protein